MSPRGGIRSGRAPALAALVLAAAVPGLAVESGGPSGARLADFDRRAVARIAEPPLGLPPVPLPAGHEVTAAEVRLGRKLFLDRRLSRNGSLSCAMCHVPEQGFTVNELRTAVGMEGKTLLRSSPTLLNVAYAAPFFHDGREPDLDLQAFDVFLNPDEMAAPSLGWVVARVGALPEYPELFADAFGAPPSVAGIGRALATYMRSLLAAESPFDRWYYGGDQTAVSAAARRGFGVFRGKGGCTACHTVGEEAALFTDHGFHDTGVARTALARSRDRTAPVRVELAPGLYAEVAKAVVESVGKPVPPDLGRYAATANPDHRWQFKTPSLRNVALTAPYMHDGSLSTLRDVVEHYDRGGGGHAGLDPRIRPLHLAEGEKDDLVAFLESLTGSNVAELVADARSETIGNPGGEPGSEASRTAPRP